MFHNDYLVEYIDVTNFKTENVQSMKGMFCNCNNVKELNTQKFKTGKVTNFDYMFTNCTNVKELDLTSFITLNSSSFIDIFNGCDNMIVIIQENINDFEKLLDAILNSDVNIRFLPMEIE